MEDVESVSDSELDLNRDVFDDTTVIVPRRGVKCWGTVVRRSSIGWFGSTSSPNDNSATIALQPERIIELLRAPSVQTYNTLKRKLDKSKNDPSWILQFLNNDGLELLFESFDQLCQRKTDNFLNVILQVSCVECIKSVMDSSLGLDYIVENKEFTRKLASALDTDNVTVKKQVFELLSALCVYSKDGFARALDAIDYYKVAKKHKYRFSLIIDELQRSDNPQYKTILLEFINCIIIYTVQINDRVRIRNEFYGLKLQEVLNGLRRQADTDPNLEVQLDVFDEHKANDDEQLPGAKGVDLNSSLDVFHAIFRKVCETPQELPFLTMLQHLLKIDQTEKTSELIWETVETLVNKATVIESSDDSKKLLQSFSKKREQSSECKCTCSCHKEDSDRHRVTSPRQKLSSGVHAESVESEPPPVPPHMTSPSLQPTNTPVPAPPPPPPPPTFGAPPPPAPPIGFGAPPPPPPPGPGGGLFQKAQKKLPQQNIPKPKTKMRTLQWQKIPLNKVMGKSNIWTMGGQLYQGYNSKIDYQQMEELFSVTKMHQVQKDQSDSASVQEKKRKENAEVNLLDAKRSLNVNIFLKQFRMTNDEIVQLLHDGVSSKFGAERLRSLQKILPVQEEVDMFRSFDGDRAKLGTAEKFFMCLMGLPNYRLRVEGLMIKEEFNSNIEWIRPSIDSVIEAAKDIKENKNLHELMYLVLLAGNYLNAGNYAGDAAGFKLTSLLKLAETRANKPRMNLMHFVVMQAEEKNPMLLNLPDEMKFLKDAAQASLDNLTNDIKSLDSKLATVNSSIKSVGSDFKKQMKDFLEFANKEMIELKEDLKDVASLRLELADFFCEDPKTFKLEETFKDLQTFFERFTKSKLENQQRKANEEKMEARRRQKEEELQKKHMAEVKPVDSHHNEEEDEGSIVEMLLADVRSGFKKFGETNFSVTKVQKINLENSNIPNGDVAVSESPSAGFVRQGYGRKSMRSRRKPVQDIDSPNQNGLDNGDSKSVSSLSEDLNQKRTRRSYAVDTDDTLFDLLMQADKDGEQSPAEGQLERVGSLRRRRQDRRQQRGSLGVDLIDRERATSPNVEVNNMDNLSKERPKSDIMGDDFDFRRRSLRRSSSGGINIDFSDRVVSSPHIEALNMDKVTSERPKSDNMDDNVEYRSGQQGVRRTRSMYDKSTLEIPSNMPRRPYDPNNNKSEGDLSIERSHSPSFRSDDPTRRSSRWRRDINDAKNMPIIDERARLVTPTKDIISTSDSAKNSKPVTVSPTKDVVSTFDRFEDSAPVTMTKDDSFASVEKKNKALMLRRFSSNLDHNEIRKVLAAAEDVKSNAEVVKSKTDEHSVSHSVRKTLSRRWQSDLGKSNIDKVLKAIEDTGKQIDDIGKDGSQNESNSDTEDTTAKSEFAPDTEVALKVKRVKRKQRSTLSMDDIHAAFQKIDDKIDDLNASKSPTFERKKKVKQAPHPPKSQRPNSDGNVEIISVDDSNTSDRYNRSTNNKDTMSKAAKLAARKRFRDQRFGDKDTPAQKAMLEHSQGRWKSNVEKENVDEAFRDLVSKNMSRSKSYDEAVARKLMSEAEDSTINYTERSTSLRNSVNKLFNDGRRNGRVFNSDDSDTETTLGSSSPRRPSSTRSDSPKSCSGRLSIKSTNTSTETLRAEVYSDGESSPEQSRKNSVGKRINDKLLARSTPSPSFSNRISDGKDSPLVPTHIRQDLIIGSVKGESSLAKFEARIAFDEDDDLPQAAILKWRKKRDEKRDEKRRQSFYDNVQGLDNANVQKFQQHSETSNLEQNSYSPRSESSASHTPLSIIHKPQGSNELQSEIGSRCSYASSSDSASRDEGFETMSGTVSQRTSLSSTLESEFTPNYIKKTEQMSKLQINENLIAANARSSVTDTKKQRTESWTEAVANNVGNINKDSSLDSSMEYTATSPDSGHGTLKDESWAEQSDMDSTIKSKASSADLNDSQRPMSPMSQSGTNKPEKKVPSYMRGTASSGVRKQRTSSQGSDLDRSSTTPTTRQNRLSRGPTGLSNQSLHKGKAGGSNTSIVSITSNLSEATTPSRMNKRISHHGTKERPSSVHSVPAARSTTPSVPRSTTPTVHSRTSLGSHTRVAAKPAAHATSTVGARTTPTRTAPSVRVTATTTPTSRTSAKSKPAPPPPANRSKTPNPTRSTTPVATPTKLRSATPNPSINRPTTPLADTPTAPSRLKRSQSLRVSSANRPSFGSTTPSRESNKPSFMSPTASSKARKDLANDDDESPPTPPPRRSKDTDALSSSTNPAPSPLKRHASLRLPGRSANKTGRDSPSVDVNKHSNDNKIKGFMHRIGGHGSKVRPESADISKLAPVEEGMEADCVEDSANNAKEGNKSPSLRKILGLRGKDKSVRKSIETAKSETDKKRKPSK